MEAETVENSDGCYWQQGFMGKTFKGVLFLSIFSSVCVKLCCHIQQSWKLAVINTDTPVWLLLVTLPEPGIFSYDQTLKCPGK